MGEGVNYVVLRGGLDSSKRHGTERGDVDASTGRLGDWTSLMPNEFLQTNFFESECFYRHKFLTFLRLFLRSSNDAEKLKLKFGKNP